VCSAIACGQPLTHHSANIRSAGARVRIEEYRPRASAGSAVLVLLYGSGGAHSSGVPYVDEARLFAAKNCAVYLPHYLDVTTGSAAEPQSHYELWAKTVEDALRWIASRTGIARDRTVIAGYSLGGSVALAVAAAQPGLGGIVVWSGSLPDAYRDVEALPPLLILHGGRDTVVPASDARQLAALCTIRKFRCDLSIYPEEGHAFSAEGIGRANQQILTFLNRILRPR